MENETKKILAITGASNGMGYEAARLFAARGWQVFAGARRLGKIPTDAGITPLRLDVTDSASNQAFIAAVLAATDGRIDVLINNAGYGEYGPAEEIPLAKVRKQFETNFFGAVELTNLVLPVMRAQHSGRIINISSVGGNMYTPLGTYYHATKAALQQWSDVLDMELADFGVRSIIVQPGGTQSDWGTIAFDNAEKNLMPDSPYQPLVGKIRGMFSRFSSSATSADLAQVFYRAATDEKAKLRYYNAMRDRMMVRIAKVHPEIWRRSLKSLLKRKK